MEPRPYTLFADLVAEAPIPARGILSQTIWDEGDHRLVLFAFAPGEELSEHAASRPAIVHILSGEAYVVVDGDEFAGRTGAWFKMAPEVKHSIHARTPLVMALYLLPTLAAAESTG